MLHKILPLLLLCFLALPAVAAEDQQECEVSQKAAGAVALVEKAAAYVQAHGKEKAIAAFHDPDGEFIDGELYILFYAYDGTCFANGFKPKLAGFNRYNVRDPDGVYQIREMIELSKAGGGWVHYRFDNPTTGSIDPKSTFVMPAPGLEAFVGCGIYGLPK